MVIDQNGGQGLVQEQLVRISESGNGGLLTLGFVGTPWSTALGLGGWVVGAGLAVAQVVIAWRRRVRG